MTSEFNFINKKNEFYKDLKNNYSIAPNSYSTHTSIGEPKGAWHISKECLKRFYSIYSEACFKYNIDVHMTERHTEFSPILIDLDFRYDIEHPDRLFDINFIKKIIEFYNQIIKKAYVEVPDNLLESYVLLKEHPIRDNDKYKDGIHIVYPYLVTKPDIQKWFRSTIISDYKAELKELFSQINCINPISDIFDDKVIFDTNWQLYGSKKPHNIPYKLIYILDSKGNLVVNDYLEDNYKTKCKLVDLFSIRNKDETKLILNYEDHKMEKWLKEHSEKKVYSTEKKFTMDKDAPKRSISKCKIFGKPADDQNLEYVNELVLNCLSETRADRFDDWIKVGILLHNIDYTLLQTWINFSQKSPKFKAGECEEKWDKLPVSSNKQNNTVNPELCIGSLIYWSKEDNYDKYKEIHNKYNKTVSNNSTLAKLLYNSQDAAHTDIANVIYRYFNGFGLSEEIRFMCYNISKKLWCEYITSQHKWVEDIEDNAGHCIRQTFDTEIYKLYTVDYTTILTQRLAAAIENEDEQQQKRIEEDKLKILKLSKQLKITGFRDTLLKECSNRFHLKNCRNQLDTNLGLISFTNGVYDLEEGIFRDGRPSDFISLSTNLEYNNYTHTSPEIVQLKNILSQILPIAPVREYFLHILSTCLSGKQYFEKFFVLTGSGSNGKSKLIELIRNTLGDYYHQMNVAALCSKRGSSNAADPELAMLRGRRFVAFQEPSKDEPINVGKLKEWSGGDQIQTRELYKGPIRFECQAKWFLICNDIPDIPSDDDGTWRRLTVINFPSKFLPESQMTGRDYEYKRINNMNDILQELREPFIWLLIDYYKKFKQMMKTTGLVEPKEIIDATDNERKKNNPIKQFVSERVVYSPNKNDKFNITDIYNVFRNFMADSGHNPKLLPRRNDFLEKFNIEYVNLIKANSNKILEINKHKTSWIHVKYFLEKPSENVSNNSIIQDSDSENDENEDNMEIINMDDISDSE